jgi:threonine synthase
VAATGSALCHLECSACHAQLDADTIRQLCACGSPLLAKYDLARLANPALRDEVMRRKPDLWRWRELLPVRNDAHCVSLGETATPIVPLARIGAEIGITALAFKDEGLLPTGSFKARGAAVGISRAWELGVSSFAMATNGNAGGAWAAYARRAGMEAWIAMPRNAPAIHRFESTMVGAHVSLVDGVISDAGRFVQHIIEERGAYDASTLKEPYRIEGKKTLGFEIAEQFAWNVPDVIVYPTGGGVGLIGIDKALRELQELGWIEQRLPRMVAVQASGCAPIVRAWEAGERTSQYWENAKTIAFGITVPKALGDFLVLDSLYQTGGCAVAVDDDAIACARTRLAAEEGAILCPEGAATLAAADRLRASGWIQGHERVLLINTGLGLKYSFSETDELSSPFPSRSSLPQVFASPNP